MSSLQSVIDNPYIKLVRRHVAIWLVPTVAIGVLGSFYALLKPSVWEASQGFLVRDTLLELSQQGRFNTTDARKAAQETILEVARNRQVVESALRDVVPKKKQGRTFPSDTLIAEFQDVIAVTAPRGAEFGETDLIYLRVKGKSPDAAIDNANAVAKHMQLYLSYLSDRHTESISQELREKLELTQEKLDLATAELEAMEREVGSDLGELRTLNQSASGESNVRNQIGQTKSELRAAQTKRTAQVKALEFLLAARRNPETIAATPASIIETQPALKRLKDGLVDAQLRLSDLKGKMNATHPKVRAAEIALIEIRRSLHAELEVAIRSCRAEMQVTEALISSYISQLETLQDRFKVIGGLRARYEILVANVRDWSEQVKEAQRALAAADARLETTASQLTLVNEPDVGDKPLGPGRTILILASWVGGFFTGIGLLFVLVTPSGEGQRGSFRGFGRRASDRTGETVRGRRASDRQQAAPQHQVGDRRASDRSVAESATCATDETVSLPPEALVRTVQERRIPSTHDTSNQRNAGNNVQAGDANSESQSYSAQPSPFPTFDLPNNPLTDVQQSRE